MCSEIINKAINPMRNCLVFWFTNYITTKIGICAPVNQRSLDFYPQIFPKQCKFSNPFRLNGLRTMDLPLISQNTSSDFYKDLAKG